MQKRITCFICSLSSGGAEHQLTELTRQLSERGYSITITTFADVPDHYTCAQTVIRKRLAVNRNKFIKILSIFWYFLCLKTDVVISFGQRENSLCLIPLLFRRKIRVINGERNLTAGRSSRVERLLTKWLYKRSNYIVSNSFSQRDNIISLSPKLKEKTKVIINYLDTNHYTPSNNTTNNDPIRIGIFCRYAPQKNCLRFADAVKFLKDEGYKIEVCWYGNQSSNNGSNEYFLMFDEYVRKIGIGDCLHLNNHVKAVNKCMQQFDAICLPSLWEGFSNTIAEAISCGKPTLVSNVSDNSIMVEDGVNGYLFNPLKVEDIANALKKFISLTVSERVRFGKASRKKALEIFDTNNFVNSYIRLIN